MEELKRECCSILAYSKLRTITVMSSNLYQPLVPEPGCSLLAATVLIRTNAICAPEDSDSHRIAEETICIKSITQPIEYIHYSRVTSIETFYYKRSFGRWACLQVPDQFFILYIQYGNFSASIYSQTENSKAV